MVDPGALRRLALFTALKPNLAKSPSHARSFAIPPALAPADAESVIFGASTSVYLVADTPTTHYSLEGLTTAPLKGHVYVYAEREAPGQFLVELLTRLYSGERGGQYLPEVMTALACTTPSSP